MSNLTDFAVGPMSEPTSTTNPVVPVIAPEAPARKGRRDRFPNVTTLAAIVLAAVLYAIGWLVGIVSIPCNWCMGALRAGWYDARRRGGL